MHTFLNFAKGIFPADRLLLIAQYLGITTEHLLIGEEKAPTEPSERKFRDDEIKFALPRSGEQEITDGMFDEVRRFAEFVAHREEGKNVSNSDTKT